MSEPEKLTEALVGAVRCLQRIADADGQHHGDAIATLWMVGSAVSPTGRVEDWLESLPGDPEDGE